MADKEKSYGSVKRFGVRYGTKQKGKVCKIEAERHLATKCPYCHYDQVSRVSSGIWHCRKCKAKFAGKAYVPGGHVAIGGNIEQTVKAGETPVDEKSSEEEINQLDEETAEKQNGSEQP